MAELAARAALVSSTLGLGLEETNHGTQCHRDEPAGCVGDSGSNGESDKVPVAVGSDGGSGGGIAVCQSVKEVGSGGSVVLAVHSADLEGVQATGRGRRRNLPASFSQQASCSSGTAEAITSGGTAAKTEVDSTLPRMQFDGRCVYAGTIAECVEACAMLELALKKGGTGNDTNPKVLGFDCEWRVSYQRGVAPPPVATVQLSSCETAVVFHISRCGGLPGPLAALLANEDVIKVGVGAEGDAHKLAADYSLKVINGTSPFRARSVVDLNEVAWRALHGAQPGTRVKKSLRTLCCELLSQNLSKDEDVRCGNWEAVPLSQTQVDYAATDAWAGYRCFEVLHSRAPKSLEASLATSSFGIGEPSAPCVRKRKAPGDGCTSEPVAEASTILDLPPAKRLCHRLFCENGLTVDSIAELRGVQTGTVRSYLADAIAAGHAYDLADFELSADDRTAITKAFAAIPSEAGHWGSLKALKEALPDHIEYWAIKVMQAHLARTAKTEPG